MHSTAQINTATGNVDPVIAWELLLIHGIAEIQSCGICRWWKSIGCRNPEFMRAGAPVPVLAEQVKLCDNFERKSVGCDDGRT